MPSASNAPSATAERRPTATAGKLLVVGRRCTGRGAFRVTVWNYDDPVKSIAFDALADAGTSHLTLPAAWRDRLGDFDSARPVDLASGTRGLLVADLCGPALIQVNNFRLFTGEVLFVEMEPRADGTYEPLLGSIPVALSHVGV